MSRVIEEEEEKGGLHCIAQEMDSDICSTAMLCKDLCWMRLGSMLSLNAVCIAAVFYLHIFIYRYALPLSLSVNSSALFRMLLLLLVGFFIEDQMAIQN